MNNNEGALLAEHNSDLVKQLQQRLLESEAANAVMREALKFVQREAVFGVGCTSMKPWTTIFDALSTTAGKPLLEELEGLRKDKALWESSSKGWENKHDSLLEERDRYALALKVIADEETPRSDTTRIAWEVLRKPTPQPTATKEKE